MPSSDPPRVATARAGVRIVPLILVTAMVVGLPVAAWIDVKRLSEARLVQQAENISAMVTSMRAYYASNVVARVQEGGNGTQVAHNYLQIPGAIPLPATLSLELGEVLAERQANIGYRFVSDYPFRNRAAHPLDDFERAALAGLRADPTRQFQQISWTGGVNEVRVVTPIIMNAACVACHNHHPDSIKTDWKVGDVRGIQEVTVTQRVAGSVLSFSALLAYLVISGAIGAWFVMQQWRHVRLIDSANRALEKTNVFLEGLSSKISRYLSPQVYRSIFSGEKDVRIDTQRKKLTIFFSDIKDFTSTTERLQPEEMTALLNEYLSEMSTLALQFGGTIDKFIGDAIVIFFGDPESRGVAEDARACVRMAVAMQRRLSELNVLWRSRGVEQPFLVRMGVNTGYCNVGNFGSSERMDYTIIGGEANLAARLQSIAEPGKIVISYETHALVRDIVQGRPLAPITVKGISREILPYVIDALVDAAAVPASVIAERGPGVELYVDVERIDVATAARLRDRLAQAVVELEHRATRDLPDN